MTFEPLIAVIHEVEALCWYGKGSKQKNSIHIQAAAKCAQLLVSIKHKQPEDQDQEGFQKVLHFGYVPVGSIAERQIRLYNPSAVCMHWEGIGKREWARFRDPPQAWVYLQIPLPSHPQTQSLACF